MLLFCGGGFWVALQVDDKMLVRCDVGLRDVLMVCSR